MFFSHFWAYVGQPHGHIGWAKSMPFASINPTNPRTNPWKFHEKILRIGGAGKWGFFEAAILNFLSRPFWIFFCFISVKNPALLYEVSFFSALWMVFPESWKRSCPNFYAHDCNSSPHRWYCHFWDWHNWYLTLLIKLKLIFVNIGTLNYWYWAQFTLTFVKLDISDLRNDWHLQVLMLGIIGISCFRFLE